MNRVLVTGACGLIGSHLSASLCRDGVSVVGLDDLSFGTLESVADLPGFTLVRGSVLDEAAVARAADGCDAVVHLAARKIPRYGDRLETLRVNSLGAQNVLAEAVRRRARTLIASTSDVYGMNDEVPFSEDSFSVIGPPTVPRWSYALSKLYNEQLALAHAQESGLRVTILRFFGTYGPRHHLSWRAGPQSVFISAALRGEPLTVHGDGLQTRCFIYIDDLIESVRRLLACDAAAGEVVNVGTTEETTILAMAELVWRLVRGGPPRIEMVPYAQFGRYQDVRRRVPDIGKLAALTGFTPSISLEEGLRRTIAWQRTVA